MTAEVHCFSQAGELAAAVARRLLADLAGHPVNRSCCLALSGGRVARDFFTALAALAVERIELFSHAHFFWADERCVPPDHGESNYLLASTHLLQPLDIPSDRIHRIQGERPPDDAAREAEVELRRYAPVNANGVPVLDYIFLGMGEDGHVASLFPGAPATKSETAYIPVVSPKPPPHRITLTYPALQGAENVWVLASGPGKEKAWRESLSPEGRTPLARLIQTRPSTVLFTDILTRPQDRKQ